MSFMALKVPNPPGLNRVRKSRERLENAETRAKARRIHISEPFRGLKPASPDF
jgi:hypothetical protein